MDDLSRLTKHDEITAHLELAMDRIEVLDEKDRTGVRADLQRAHHRVETSRAKLEGRIRASGRAAERAEQKRTRA